MIKSSRKVRHRKRSKPQTRRERERREHRYSVREELYTVSSLKRVRDCGRPMGSTVGIRVSGTGADRLAGHARTTRKSSNGSVDTALRKLTRRAP